MTVQPSRLALGAMMFGAWGNPSETECRRMVDIALDHGITLFDTADIYDYGVSEQILGRALTGRRNDVLVATKVGNPMDDDPAHAGLSPRWVRQACDASLRRLGTEWIDLYQLHRPDPRTPIADTLGVLRELVEAGKVRAVGTSTFTVEELEEAWHAGPLRPAAEQPPYSLLVRGAEAEVLPWCAAHRVDVFVWAPLNGGWLTGKYQSGALDPSGRAVRKAEHFDHRDTEIRERKRRLVDGLIEIADASGLTIVELALGFILSHPAVTSLLLGPRTPEQLSALLAVRAEPLATDTLAAIDAVVAPAMNVNPADTGR